MSDVCKEEPLMYEGMGLSAVAEEAAMAAGEVAGIDSARVEDTGAAGLEETGQFQ